MWGRKLLCSLPFGFRAFSTKIKWVINRYEDDGTFCKLAEKKKILKQTNLKRGTDNSKPWANLTGH